MPRPSTGSGNAGSSAIRDVAALLALALVVLAFHIPIASPGAVVADYDLFTYFYPYWQYRNEVMAGGSLPLWNPYIFTGVPFLANIQTGVLYPLNLLFLGQELAPRAVALSYILHLSLAAAGMYLLLRILGTGALGGIAGALVFSLGGFFAAQAGHINQVQAAAWLPFMAAAFIRAYQCRNPVWIVAGGVFVAFQLTAGHPQESYLSFAALALLALYSAVHSGAASHRLHWAGWGLYAFLVLGLVLAVGAGLAAVQLLPSLELAGESIRAGGLPYPEGASFSLQPWVLLRTFLPGFVDAPFSEYNAYVGVSGAVLAWTAVWWWRPRPYTYFFLAAFVIGLFMAIGGYNPFYRALYEIVPGLNLFRVPARWLLLCAFGVAGLAGMGLDSLARVDGRRLSFPSIGGTILGFAGSLLLCFGIVWALRDVLDLPGPEVLRWWVGVAIAALALTTFGAALLRGAWLSLPLLALVTVELFYARSPLPVSHPLPQQVYTTVRPALAHLLQDPGDYRTLSIADLAYEIGDARELRAAWEAALPSGEVERFIEAIKLQEMLAPNIGMRFRRASLDGYDGGVLPLRRYAELKDRLLRNGNQAVYGDAPQPPTEDAALIRDEILGVPSGALLGALSVKYVVSDRLNDAWPEGIYHDLGLPQRLAPGRRLEVRDLPAPGGATSLSLATYIEGGAGIMDGIQVATVSLVERNGAVHTWPLQAGIHTADQGALSHSKALPGAPRVRPSKGRTQLRLAYLLRLDFAGVAFPERLVIEAQQPEGYFVVAAATLIDARTGAGYALDIDPRLKRVLTGDLKVYENRDVRGRLHFAEAPVIRPEDRDQLQALDGLGPDQVVLRAAAAAGSSGVPPPSPDQRGGDARISVATATPERLRAIVEAPRDGYLVVNDGYYPGWRAWVDGQETPVLRANYLSRAIAVPAGRHQVELRYLPQPLLLGYQVTAATAAGLAIILALASLSWLVLRAGRWWRRIIDNK